MTSKMRGMPRSYTNRWILRRGDACVAQGGSKTRPYKNNLSFR